MGLQAAPSAASPQDAAAAPVANRTATPPSPPTSSADLTSSATSSAPSSPHTPTSSPNRSSDSTPSPTPKITSRQSRAPPPPPGLFNLGNTCYLNSVVQVLYHVPAFRKAILAHSHRDIDPKRAPALEFACDLVAALRSVFQALDDAYDAALCLHDQASPPPSFANGLRPHTRSQTDPQLDLGDEAKSNASCVDDPEPLLRDGIDYIAPQRIIDLLRDHDRCQEFDARGQQDAHEFLRFLLDKVNDCMQMMDDDDKSANYLDSVTLGRSSSFGKHGLAGNAVVSDMRHKHYGTEGDGYESLRSLEKRSTETGPGDGTMASSSTSAGLQTSNADTEHEGSNPSFSNSESKHADRSTRGVESEKSVPDSSSTIYEGSGAQKAALRQQQTASDGQHVDDIPGNGVQAPILSRTAGESSQGELDPAASSRRQNTTCISGVDMDAARSPPAAVNSRLSSADSAEDKQKSPVAKRRKRELESDSHSGTAGPMEVSGDGPQGGARAHGQPTSGKRARDSTIDPRPLKRYRKNLVSDLFEGRAITATRCYECDSQSDRRETFLDVSLPVEHGRNLDWALSTQCVEEQLVDRNKYYCDNCKTYTEAKRWWQVASLPEVFTVHLKLFAYSARLAGPGGKVSVAMPCPVRTRLAEWCVSKCAHRDDEYKLTAVIVHEGGTANSGHYYSYIYKAGQDSQWYCCDDSYVVSASEEEVKTRLFTTMKTRRTAYLLFYSNSRDLEVQSC